MNKCVKQLLLVLSLSFVVIFAALALLTLPVRAADQCVAPGGAGGCHASIQAAVDAASSGDTVRVVAGTYTENVVISKSVTLLGGFDDTSLASRTPRSSIIDGGGNDSVIKISHSATVTIDGFTITGGDATANGGEGGGIAIREATANILDNLIEGNVGSSNPAVRGRGGGIDVISSTSPVLISDNTIRANMAYSVVLTSPTVALFGIGGGIWLDAASSALITGNQVLSNVAARTDVPGVAFGGGGGVGGGGDKTSMTIDGNTIQDNIGNAVGGDGVGGGIAMFSIGVATITNNSVVQNTAAVSGTFVTGGGIRATVVQTLTLADNWVAQNIAAIRGPDAQGGGVYLAAASSSSGQSLTLTGNWVMSNTAGVTVTGSTSFGGPFASGGGVRIWGGDADNDTLTMQDNYLIGNVAAWNMATSAGSGAGHAQGGGLTVERISTTLIISNEVRGNMAVEDMSLSGSGDQGGGSSGGGMHLRDNDSVTLRENEVRDNVTAKTQTVSGVSSGSEAGGISLINVRNSTVNNNMVSGNTAVITGSLTGTTGDYYNINGGGLNITCWGTPNCSLSLEDNQVINNTAAQMTTVSGSGASSEIDGGGLHVSSLSTTLIISNEVRGNVAVETFSLSGSGGWSGRPSGGGMYLANIDVMTAANNEIHNNISARQQVMSDVSSDTDGGGIMLRDVKNATVNDNVISSNTSVVSASITSDLGEDYSSNGGGIRVACYSESNCTLTLAGNDILNNTAAHTVTIGGSNARGDANGGGLSAYKASSLTLSGNQVMSNTAVVSLSTVVPSQDASANGGGINIDGYDIPDDSLRLENNKVIGNIAAGTMTISGTDTTGHVDGGGLHINSISTTFIINNEVRGNIAVENLSVSGSGGWGGRPSGGGMFLVDNDTMMVNNNEIRNNVTAGEQVVNEVSSNSEGGGITLANVENATVSTNMIADNTVVVTGSLTSNTGQNYFPNGGGIMVGCWNRPSCNLSFVDNDILNNVVARAFVLNGTDVNGTPLGGGFSLNQGTALLQRNIISGNTANLGSNGGAGGAIQDDNGSTLVMNQNHILGNRTDQAGFGIPAVWVWQSSLTTTNDIFARNTGGIGSGTSGLPVKVAIINDTFYDNGDRAIEVNGTASTVYVTNTIVYSHEDGLRLNDPASILIGNYNLLSNTTNYAVGATGGANDILNQDPLFVNAAADDFHLSSNSPAVDKGNDAAAPTIDFEGDQRPFDGDFDGTAQVDIGADELGAVLHLPIILRNP